MDLNAIRLKQRKYFESGATLPVHFRIEKLKQLRASVLAHEAEISAALAADLGKNNFEAFMCETGLVLEELSYLIKNLKKLAAEKPAHTPLVSFPGRSYVKPEPLGNVLIISPWNYPFLLCIEPLADAIAAGNTAMLKPSSNAPETAKITGRIIRECFAEEYVFCACDCIEAARSLAKEKFDLIFFTGSVAAGREIYMHAAENLTPAVLELGGKSPCIVDESADIKIAARRIVFGKFLNCGQTCVAPDYVLCHYSAAAELRKQLAEQIKLQYGEEPLLNPGYGRIVNRKHFDRLCGLIASSNIFYGGKSDKSALKIEPSVICDVSWQDKIMQEEIFGPLLPVLEYKEKTEIFEILAEKPKPLALYIFSKDNAAARHIIEKCRFGGGCINDTIMHLASSEMGFGGVGESGIGSYHGEAGFRAFSHYKSIYCNKTWPDLPFRYMPHNDKFLSFIKRLLG